MPSKDYASREYKAARAKLIGQPCWKCGKPADQVDHVPALSAFAPGQWQGRLMPVCRRCNASHGARIANARRAVEAAASHRPTRW